MKNSFLTVAVVVVFGIAASNDSVAQATSGGEDLIWVVYRDSEGELTKRSKKFARLMEKKAAQEGQISLWLTANLTFNPYTDQLTDQQIAEQNQRVHVAFNEVLQPLIDTRLVWHPSGGPNISGPGCLVYANAAGVAQLVNDDRLLHITVVR